MKWSGLLLLVCCGTAPNDVKHEICGNGKDDDENGLTDCADPNCFGHDGCDGVVDAGPQYGACSKCGLACVKQADCLSSDFSYDRPLPLCVSGKCQSLGQAVQIDLSFDNAAWGVPSAIPRCVNTRFVSKAAIDGSAVSCATLAAAAMGKTAADADQIEKSGRFNLVGYDVTPVTWGTSFPVLFVNVETSSQFLIWSEFWYGPRDSTTKLPTANRASFGCVEMGDAVAPITRADQCDVVSDGGCRTIKLAIPPP